MYYTAKTVTDGVFVAGGTIATVGSVGETIITAPTGVGVLAGSVATPAAISFTAKGIYNFSNDLEKLSLARVRILKDRVNLSMQVLIRKGWIKHQRIVQMENG